MTPQQRTSSGDWRRHERRRPMMEPPNYADLILKETRALAHEIGEQAAYDFCQSLSDDLSPFQTWAAIQLHRIRAEIARWHREHDTAQHKIYCVVGAVSKMPRNFDTKEEAEKYLQNPNAPIGAVMFEIVAEEA